MFRANARWIVASVAHAHGGPLVRRQVPRDTMRLSHPTAQPKMTVAACRLRSAPYPALSQLLHLRPKAQSNGLAHGRAEGIHGPLSVRRVAPQEHSAISTVR